MAYSDGNDADVAVNVTDSVLFAADNIRCCLAGVSFVHKCANSMNGITQQTWLVGHTYTAYIWKFC